ncbi:MAG: crotonase/enoyl-CoA hydratase family protein, partial [Saprospiraceae bacterium]
MNYKIFSVEIKDHLAKVVLNRPEKANSIPQEGWDEMQAIFAQLDAEEAVRVIILSGAGKCFCAGIDLSLLMSVQQLNDLNCEARKREQLRKFILDLQAAVNAIEQCRKPVIAAVHGACIGGGVDIIAACDLRYCTEDAYFTIKEIDMGMVADLGTLQRLPKIIAPGIAAEMAYTGRNVSGTEAAKINLVNQAYRDQTAMEQGVQEIATMIASKSPVSIRGTKEMLRYTRDHSVTEGLQYMATWNASYLLSN